MSNSDLEAFLTSTAVERLESYKEFLRIPSISTLPQRAPDCRRAAVWLADELGRIGIENAEVSETAGLPMVYGDWIHAPGAPTVLVYGHYDVQPVEPLSEWHTDPFEPAVSGNRMIGRGAADDKGQIHIHLKAVEALLATRSRIPVNLRFIFEGEEEASSAHLSDWLESNRHRLSADVAIISDTGFFDGNIPAITVGLRGITYIQIDVTGPSGDLHSGSFGGTVKNPANALCEILANLKDDSGRVLVTGFYDDVIPLSETDRKEFAALPFNETAYLASIGVPELVGEEGYTTLERRGARPTLDINGIWSGFQGEGSMTIIPASAHAKVSCRLVANQDPIDIAERLSAYILESSPPGVKTQVQFLGSGRPSLMPLDHPAVRAAADALDATFGRQPVYVREGGSIPACEKLATTFGLPIVLLGFTPPDDNAHAPNESMDLDNYERAIRTVIQYFDNLATASL
ncbi:MAG TPA: dipeptidase [Candidatus Nanopelagicaceae bacterium]|nr:dipeptidase [Candidatus Nanopelagicaceae bacterium]